MANGDSLQDLIAAARREMPDVPDEVWQRFLNIAAGVAGARRVYVPTRRKALNLEALAKADEEATNAQVAEKLGLSRRQVQRLKRLSDD